MRADRTKGSKIRANCSKKEFRIGYLTWLVRNGIRVEEAIKLLEYFGYNERGFKINEFKDQK